MSTKPPPKNWQHDRLENLVFFQRGFDITKAQQRPGPYPVISSSGITSFHDEFKVHGPGVVIGRKGTLGSIHFTNGDYWPHDTTLWSKDLRGNNARFVYYFLHTIDMKRFDVGNSNPTLNRNHIHSQPVLIPRRDIQDRISDLLSKYDDLIENNLRRIALLEKAARLIYEEWFVRLRFPGYERTQIVDGVPEGWQKVPVPSIIDVNPKTVVNSRETICFVPMAALSETSMLVDFGLLEERPKVTGPRFQNGDVLFPRITPCLENGKTGYVNFLEEAEVACGSTEFIVLRGNRVGPTFVYCLARTYEFRENAIKSMIGSSGRQRVQTSCFDEFLVHLPDDLILGEYDELTSPLFEEIRVLHLQNHKFKQARDLLLPRLMSGEIAV